MENGEKAGNVFLDKEGKTGIQDDDLIRIRKDKIIKFLKRDIYLNIFLGIAVISLLVGIFGFKLFGLNINGLGFGFFSSLFTLKFFGSLHLASWLLILSVISAVFVYYKKRNFAVWPMVIFIAILASNIRTRNLEKLKDITTNTWTLGPDLDPFYFLRLSKYIIENGNLFAVDMMRYVPLGFDMKGEYLLHPYMMAWFHKFALIFGSESVTFSAILYPVFMFALTVIAFFLLTREIFGESLGSKKSNLIALIASFFLSILPVILPRTIAGIPEKESASFLFIFLAFYFFLKAWNSKQNISKYIFAILSGLATGAMANIWGGYIFIFTSIAPAVFFAFLLGKFDEKDKIYIYASWLIVSIIIMLITRYSIGSLFGSISTAPAIAVLFILIINKILFNTGVKNYLRKYSKKMPPQIISVIVSVITLAILSSAIFGLSFIPSQIVGIKNTLVQPAVSRLIQTVAENRQPYFNEWAGNFGPFVRNVPIFFWLFFVGSIYMFYKMSYILNIKERTYLTLSYFIFLFGVVFSRYSGESTLNGTNFVSLALYAFGVIALLSCFGFYYYKFYKHGKLDQFKRINFGFILLLMFFILSIVAARAAVRTVMMLAPPISIIVSYLFVSGYYDVKRLGKGLAKIIGIIIIGIAILLGLFSAIQFYNESSGQAAVYAPSVYTQQWQKAMAWVRENTPQTAVFGHWWDYGYWLQSIGERATVLDGGNSISYWNHLMGRHALTGQNDRDALEFLYAHNTTHFLIDSSDIGKYGAFSSIGSDKTYDRRSWIPTFLRDNSQIRETKNATLHIYMGGTATDGDIIYEDNGTKIFLPAGKAGIGAILLERDSVGNIIGNPRAVFVYQNQQYILPIKYTYYQGKLIDFGSGIDAGIYVLPRIEQNNIEPDGAILYLSERVVMSQLARLYLYKENNSSFKLVHSEDDFVVVQAKSAFPDMGDVIYYQGIRGPIRIWEINYPADINLNQEYLKTEYPKDLYYA